MIYQEIKKKLKRHFKEVLSVKTSPSSIAAGAAIGTFISIIPTPFLNILIAVIILLIFEKVSKIAVFAAMAFWNPLTLAPVYLLSYKIGDILFGTMPVVKYDVVILDQIYNFSRRFLVGDIILAIMFSIASFLLVFYIASKRIKR